MAQLRCRICSLPEAIRAEVHERLIGSPAVPRLSSPKVAAWLLKTHQIEVKYPAINEHLRKGHPGTEGWTPTSPGAPAAPKPDGPKGEAKARKKEPAPSPASEPAPGPEPPPSPPSPPAEPQKRPEVAFIDAILERVAQGVIDINESVRRRVNEVPADITPTPLPPELAGKGAKRLPPPGPTDAEARWITGTLSGMAQFLKVRALLMGVPGSRQALAEEGTGAGLKQVMPPLPPLPPPIEGDTPDSENDATVRGYDPARPDPEMPLAPPSGPRATDGNAPLPTGEAPKPPPLLKAVGAGAGGWSGPAGGWSPPKPPPASKAE